MYLDYKVEPETGLGTGTWWDVHYGDIQDPAFILPWRLDEEKGWTFQEPIKKYQTKSIQFSNWQPEVGDTLTIYAIVNNFSLKHTDDKIKVSFYDGHPNEGGSILTDINGNTFVETTTFLQARSAAGVEFEWVYPAGLENFHKIFAFIDPQDEMTEIHEDNNIGFNYLGLAGSEPNPTEEPLEYYSDVSVYPNPASVYAIVEFTLHKNARTVVEIYDLNGQLIKTQVDQNLGPGTWQSIIITEELPAGFYIVMVRAKNETKTAKLVVLGR
jgi:hypothetical protein